MRPLKAVVFPVAGAVAFGCGLALSLAAAAQAVYWDVEPVLSRALDRLEGRR